MKTTIKKIFASAALLGLVPHLVPYNIGSAYASNDIIFPLKEISKLECRFEKFDLLSSDCKEQMPLIKSSDYERYATMNG